MECHRLLTVDRVAYSGLSPSTESETGVVGAGPEGARPQRTSVTLHVPCTATGPAQRQRHASPNLHTPQEVRAAPQDDDLLRLLNSPSLTSSDSAVL